MLRGWALLAAVGLAMAAAGCSANGGVTQEYIDCHAAGAPAAQPAKVAAAPNIFAFDDVALQPRSDADAMPRHSGQWLAFQDGAAPATRPRPPADGGGNGSKRAVRSSSDAGQASQAKALPATEPTGFIPWQSRRGPAYPGDFWRSFGRDSKEFAPILWDDTKAAFTNPWTLAGMGLAGAAGISLSATSADHKIANHYVRQGGDLNTFWDTVGDVGGNPGTHFALAGFMYFATLDTDNVKGYETSKTLLEALAINGITTLALKGIVHTRSPNGDPWGWPSGHTSSSFALATVLAEAYGPWVGIPLYGFAGFVGYERVQARNHDFSDVISGALIGLAIGHGVAQNHKARIFGFEMLPWVDPDTGSVGLALAKEF